MKLKQKTKRQKKKTLYSIKIILCQALVIYNSYGIRLWWSSKLHSVHDKKVFMTSKQF